MAKEGFTWNDNISAETRAVLMDAITKNALDLKGESTNEAPKKFGDLEGNCEVSEWKKAGGELFRSIGYDLPYARRQHENMEYRHPLKGKPKFLEDPFNRNQKRYLAFTIKKLKEFLGK